MKRMDKFYNETYLKLETAIQELEIETDCPIKRIEAVIHHIIQSLADLKPGNFSKALKKFIAAVSGSFAIRPLL